MINTLPDDILNVIFQISSNFNNVLTCKHWHKIIIKSSNICPTCNKITKMFNTSLWITDNDDLICHGYYGTKEKYRTLKEMINREPNFLQEIKRQTNGLCLSALTKNHHAIKLVNHPTDKLIMDAVKLNSRCIKYVKNPSYDLCLRVVRTKGICIKYIPEEHKTHELCMMAVNNCPEAIKFIKEPWEDVCIVAVKNNPSLIKYIKNQTEKICIEAINNRLWLTMDTAHITTFTEDIYIALYKQHSTILSKIKYKITI